MCNAAVYLPTAKEPTFTADGFELSVGTNHLGHFLLANLLMPSLEASPDNSPAGQPRMVIVGSITGNTNTMAGNVPPKADLGDLSGLASKAPMIDGKEFDGAKAYKDSKVCNMLTMRELNKRFGGTSRVAFSSLYPGCIADTGLFRTHFQLFKTLFPLFQKYVTKGYVSQAEAGRRLAQVVSDPSMGKSGVYWSWSEKDGSFENQVSVLHLDEYLLLLSKPGVKHIKGVQCPFGAHSAKLTSWVHFMVNFGDMPVTCSHPLRKWFSDNINHRNALARHAPTTGACTYSLVPPTAMKRQLPSTTITWRAQRAASITLKPLRLVSAQAGSLPRLAQPIPCGEDTDGYLCSSADPALCSPGRRRRETQTLPLQLRRAYHVVGAITRQDPTHRERKRNR